MPNNNPVCLLALEEKPNSFLPINLKTIGFDVPDKLFMSDIDSLAMNYDEFIIRDKIRNANVVPLYAMSAKLVVLYEEEGKKRKTEFISKEIFDSFSMRQLVRENINNKGFINQLINKIKNLNVPEYLEIILIEGLKSRDETYFLQAYNALGYFAQRKLFIYTITISNKELKNSRIREKEGI